LTVRAVASGKTGMFQTDMVVHAAGRVPEINDLNLDARDRMEKRGCGSTNSCKVCRFQLCMRRETRQPVEVHRWLLWRAMKG